MGGGRGRVAGSGERERSDRSSEEERSLALFVEGKGASEDVEMDRREKEGANYRDRERN